MLCTNKISKCSKLEKKAKFDLNSRVDISQTTKVKVSKFCVVFYLKLNNIFPKSGVWTTNGVDTLKVRKKAKFDINSQVGISWTITTPAYKFWGCFRLNLGTFLQSLHPLASFVLELLSFIVMYIYIYKFYYYIVYHGPKKEPNKQWQKH